MYRMKLTALACAIATSGCVQPPHVQLSGHIAQIAAANSADLQALVKTSDGARYAAQEVALPYIAGNSVPLSSEAAMPPRLRSTNVTANFQREPVSLEKALRQLSEASGMFITSTPDALLPASMFMPRGAGSASTPVGGNSAPSAIPLMPSMPSNAQAVVLGGSAPAAGTGPLVILRSGESGSPKLLWMVLDDIARQAGLAWRPVANGAEFYRIETRIFHLPQTPALLGTNATLSRNGSSNAAFETINKTTVTLKEQDLIKGMAATVEALLTTGGRVVVSAESQSLIVTDTPQALARVARYVEDQHRNMTRRVRVVVDAYEIVSRDNNDLGFNWNLVYAHINQSIAINSPIALAGSQAGSLGFRRTSGSAAGSSVVVNALNEVATIVNQRSFPFTVTSGKPYTVAVRKTFDYANQIQLPAQSTTGSVVTTVSTPPSVMQKEETVGTFLTVIPTAKADGTIYVALYIDQTSSQPLKPFTVGGGNGGDGVTVQQKTIDGTGFIMEAPARSGVPVVMGAIETDTGTITERRLAPGAPLMLGGANQRDSQKSRTVLVVTAISEEGV